MANTLDYLPLLPLFVDYRNYVREQDEFGIYHALRLHGRIRRIKLSLPPSILHKALALMDHNFLILEHLYLSCSPSADHGHRLPLTLPKGFLAPNLHHLTLVDAGLSKRLRVLTSTVSLVTLELSIIQTSNYFRPRLLVARLRSLPLLEELTIGFSIPIPHPGTERELLGEERAPIILPSLKILRFYGGGDYLDSLVAQIRVPLLEQLYTTLFNQIAFVLPNVFYLINNTKVFKLPRATVSFRHNEVCVYTVHYHILGQIHFSLCVRCKPLDRQIDCAAQICDALIPTLSSVEELSLYCPVHQAVGYLRLETPTEMWNGAIDSAMWCNLLRGFIGVKDLYIEDPLSEELSRALQVDEVGLDQEFLPNLRSIRARRNLFTSFIDARRVVGRPVVYP